VLFEALDAALSLAVAVGLWHMRRWSGALVALNLAVAILLWPLVADVPLRAAIGRLALPGLVAVGPSCPGWCWQRCSGTTGGCGVKSRLDRPLSPGRRRLRTLP
jgi:hypothetical protein